MNRYKSDKAVGRSYGKRFAPLPKTTELDSFVTAAKPHCEFKIPRTADPTPPYTS
jgi:hypothetical protein